MRLAKFLILVVALFTASTLKADTTVIDFDGLGDSAPVTNQFSGVTFSNTTVLTAGISLNELDFPPVSGTNVVFDDGGAMTLAFAVPIDSFGGFFTYATPLTLNAFDSSNNLLASITSAFSNNLGTAGDAGSSPNEFLSLSIAGISTITITGDPAGGSFTLDNATITTTPKVSVPEPRTNSLLLIALAMCAVPCIAFRKCAVAQVRS